MASWMKSTAIGIVGIASALAVAGLGVLVVQGKRPPARTAQYVALGSSFASGFGPGWRVAPMLASRAATAIRSSWQGCLIFLWRT